MSDAAIREIMDGGGEPRPEDFLPAGCPVTVLGHQEGTYWFSDPLGQVRSKRMFRSSDILDLFLGRAEWLAGAFQGGNRNEAWNNTACAAALIQACVAAGPFDGRAVRGPGIWWEDQPLSADGQPGPVVVHCGDVVFRGGWKGGKFSLSHGLQPGCRIGGFCYKFYPPEPRLGAKPATPAEMAELLEFIQTWNWAEPDQAWLFLGLLGVGHIPALLRHRPIGLVEGDSGCGKSTLWDLVENLHGGKGAKFAVRKENASAAWLRDYFENSRSARQVILNEFEAKAGPGASRADEIVELLRYAYGGEGGWGRGGRDGAEGDAPDLAALVGAIMAPPADEQDRNRRIVLALRELRLTEESLVGLDTRLARFRALGPKFRRLVLERYPAWRAAYGAYQSALVKRGARARTITTWATALAMADVLIYPAVDQTRIDGWAERLTGDQGAVSVTASGPRAVLDRLLSYRIEEYRGSAKHTILEYLLEALGSKRPEEVLAVCKRIGVTLTDVDVPDTDNPHYAEAAAMGQVLPMRSVKMLAVATSMSGVDEIFRGTMFAAGLWKGQLLRLDGARPPDRTIRFGTHQGDDGRKKEFRTKAVILLPLQHLGIIDIDGAGHENLMGADPAPSVMASENHPAWSPGEDWRGGVR